MGERTPFTQRVDEDLQEFVADVADATNLSNADVMDEALRRLRDASHVTEDGQFVVDGEYGESGSEGDEISKEELFENQQQIIEMLSTSTSPGESAAPNKNSRGGEMDGDDGGAAEVSTLDVPADEPTETEQRMASLAGEYDHDECLDPEEVAEVDARESDVVAHDRRYLLPAVVGMINHELEHGALYEPVSWDDIRSLMRTRLDVSRGSIYNYREDLVEHGALLPHPNIDEEVVGDERVEEARRYAASATDERQPRNIDVSDFPSYKQNRYSDDPAEYLHEFDGDWELDGYYVSEEEYHEDVWEMFQVLLKEIALTPRESGSRRPNHDDQEMYRVERAAGASRMLVGLVNRLGVAFDSLQEVRDMALKADPEEESGLDDWAAMWAEVKVEVESQLFDGDEIEQDEAVEVFRECVGVDPVESSEGELSEAYREWVKANHPDSGGSKEEIDREEFGRVAEARRVLIS